MKKQKKQEGSILILTLLALVGAMSIAVAMVSISVVERKMTTKSKKSVTAFQSANSGIEWALKKINDTTVSSGNVQTIAQAFGANALDTNTGKISCPSGFFGDGKSGCEVYLLEGTNQNRTIITNPDTTLDKIIAVRATGIYGQSAEEKVGRSLEAYAMPNCPENYQRVADFCVEDDLHDEDDWQNAINFCASAGKRLCTTAELLAANYQGDFTDANSNDIGGSSGEWTADVASTSDNFYINSSGNIASDSERHQFRCCMNR